MELFMTCFATVHISAKFLVVFLIYMTFNLILYFHAREPGMINPNVDYSFDPCGR
uniref:Uncharacterized protein n=1 Tax=Lepeophtheirus salmonis TaxID=72036 RepID=A0A0K2SVT8_LEPSM